jgi:hypothetical protein
MSEPLPEPGYAVTVTYPPAMYEWTRPGGYRGSGPAYGALHRPLCPQSRLPSPSQYVDITPTRFAHFVAQGVPRCPSCQP